MYGANASGKTTLMRALFFFRNAIDASHRRWAPEGGVPREPFLLDDASTNLPSTFEVDALIHGTRYTYGFTVDSNRVLAESLFSYPRNKRQVWFERNWDGQDQFRFGKSLLGENRTIQNLTRSNSLFLSAAAQNAHHQLQPVYEWFTRQLEIVGLPARAGLHNFTANQCGDAHFRASVLQMLSSADLGIVDVEVTQQEVGEKMKKALAAFLQSVGEGDSSAPDEKSFSSIPKILLRHQSHSSVDPVGLPYEDESDGTKSLFALAGPVIRALQQGSVICIDELDSSLHPLLALGIVKMFNQPETNPNGAQLIFNTHDVNLLDGDVLRRDQIWFAEKDSGGATRFYALSDFKARREEKLGRGYLQGRYGAVPFLGRLASIGAADGE